MTQPSAFASALKSLAYQTVQASKAMVDFGDALVLADVLDSDEEARWVNARLPRSIFIRAPDA